VGGHCHRLHIGAQAMTFETWLAEVQAIVTFVIDPEE